jgi:two-component system, NtrC family, sensor histidine kinase GlrK
MRLFTHLVISHAVPILVVTLALAVLLTALVRISLVLTTLNEEELVVLRNEGTLHRYAWSLDVAMRHGQAACAEGADSDGVAAAIRPKADALRALTQEASPGPMRALARSYVTTADEITAGPTCAKLLGARIQTRRAELDEQLTNVWVDRLDELHAAVTAKDEDARRMAVSASWMGVPLAAAAFLLAMVIARRMASVVNRPLASLATMAERVGRGDFGTSVRVAGPSEVVALAEALERMRSQLEQLESLKQGFLASVSHELRTPLSKIREALALLEDGAVGTFEPRQQRVIQIARTACEREIRMVTTLLDLSRLRSGSPIRLRAGTVLDRVLQTALHDERPDAQGRGVQVDLVAPDDSPTGQLDPMLVERAVANLVRNAVAVSSKGQRVTVERTVIHDAPQRPGCWARITVHDEGPGVAPEIRESVFDAFVTQAVPQSGKPLGVGLGLALAREVAHAHGGTLKLVEDDGQGATFEMWLPMDGNAVQERPTEEGERALASSSQRATLGTRP